MNTGSGIVYVSTFGQPNMAILRSGDSLMLELPADRIVLQSYRENNVVRVVDINGATVWNNPSLAYCNFDDEELA